MKTGFIFLFLILILFNLIRIAASTQRLLLWEEKNAVANRCGNNHFGHINYNDYGRVVCEEEK